MRSFSSFNFAVLTIKITLAYFEHKNFNNYIIQCQYFTHKQGNSCIYLSAPPLRGQVRTGITRCLCS